MRKLVRIALWSLCLALVPIAAFAQEGGGGGSSAPPHSAQRVTSG